MINKLKLMSLAALFFSFTAYILLTSNLYNRSKTVIGMDQEYQFHDMKTYYENKVFPTKGVLLNSPSYIGDETYPRVPGGYFYIQYIAEYILGGKTYEGAKLVNIIFTAILSFIFLFWVYKQFGFITFSIIASLLFVNIYFLQRGNEIYNPNSAFVLSFLFLPVFALYINNDKNFIPALFLFPILALTAQSHLSNFFSIIPSLIVYLIIRWKKKTKKSIAPIFLGVFISFLTYLPYLITEFQNNFSGILKIFGRKSDLASINAFQPPQIYSILLFITNEPGNKYSGIKEMLSMWFFKNPFLIYSFIFYVISIILSIILFIFMLKKFFTKDIKTTNEKNTNLLKEFILFYLVYIIVTVIVYMFFGLGNGRPHYFLSAFTMAYIPVIYFIEYLKYKKPNWMPLAYIYCFCNIAAITIQIVFM